MPDFLDQLTTEYDRLSDPNYIKRLIAQKQAYYAPQMQKAFQLTEADLNRRGVYSPSAIVRTRGRTIGEFQRGIAKETQGEMMQRWQTLMPIIAQMKLAEKEGRMRDKAGWMKLIGTIIGTGAGFMMGGPAGAVAGGAGGGIITGEGNTYV